MTTSVAPTSATIAKLAGEKEDALLAGLRYAHAHVVLTVSHSKEVLDAAVSEGYAPSHELCTEFLDYITEKAFPSTSSPRFVLGFCFYTGKKHPRWLIVKDEKWCPVFAGENLDRKAGGEPSNEDDMTSRIATLTNRILPAFND